MAPWRWWVPAAAACVALAGCIELPDDLPAPRFDAGEDGAAGIGGGGFGGFGGFGGEGGSGGEAPPDATPPPAPDAGPSDEVCNGRDDDYDDSVDEGVRNDCNGCGPLPDEVCDGFDNDCDLVVDEAPECRCAPGIEEPCGADRGACTAGVRVCSGEGRWGPCSGLGPTPEVCNGVDDNCNGDTDEGVLNACGACGPLPDEVCDGLDADCDGHVDGREAAYDVCDCAPDEMQDCGDSDVGACSLGRQRCSGGRWTACDGAIGPRGELCNDVDDDCDGQVDEGACDCAPGDVRACGIDVGRCRAGEQTCDGGRWSDCGGDRGPINEGCNGQDDDCDGQVDEGACDCVDGETRACGQTDTGPCQRGTERCANGQWQSCQGEIAPVAEQCNGVDDDCDGQLDERWPTLGDACSAGVGACRRNGVIACSGANNAQCNAQAGPSAAEACDSVDNDCDGDTDEGLSGGACNTGQPGVCAAGTRRCDGAAQRCDAQRAPSAETCDGTDEDCDGRTDEGTGGAQCATGEPGRCAAGTRACENGALVCRRIQGPINEACNGQDDDCDGAVDDPPVLLPADCDTGLQGICAVGQPACQAGAIDCVAPAAARELCNGLDDDCDGRTDEDTGGGVCDTGRPGLCGPGRSVCVAGAMQCQADVAATTENLDFPLTCNGEDDDCDGRIDEDHPSRDDCGFEVYYCLDGRRRPCRINPDPEPIPQ